jgi:hypothetical protein
MEQMSLVKGQGITVPHEIQGRFPRISPVEEITEIVRTVLQVWGFQEAIDDGSILSNNW